MNFCSHSVRPASRRPDSSGYRNRVGDRASRGRSLARSAIEVGDRFARHRGQAQAQHVVSCCQQRIRQARHASDDWQAVPGHGAPAVPGVLLYRALRGLQVGHSRILELLNPCARNRVIETCKFHHGCDSVAAFERGDTDMLLGKQHRMGGHDLRPRHGHRVALAGLDGDPAPERICKLARPRTRCKHVMVRRHLSL